jgi:hypothetical protein
MKIQQPPPVILRQVPSLFLSRAIANLLVLLLFVTAVQAQYSYTTDNGTITITKYCGARNSSVGAEGRTNEAPGRVIGR